MKVSKVKNRNERVKLYVGGGASALPTKCMQSSEKKNEVRIGLLGASGYTGAEVWKSSYICIKHVSRFEISDMCYLSVC